MIKFFDSYFFHQTIPLDTKLAVITRLVKKFCQNTRGFPSKPGERFKLNLFKKILASKHFCGHAKYIFDNPCEKFPTPFGNMFCYVLKNL